MTAPSATAGAGQHTPGRRPLRSASAAPRRFRIVLALLAVLAVLLGTDAALVDRRIDRFDVDLHAGPGTTWVLVGLDSRTELPAGAPREAFGTTEDVPGSRADVVLVLHETAEGFHALSVPRDVMVRSGTYAGRLALSWLDGPQGTLDGLCGLGIPADHVVALDLAGFAAVVDALGGLDMDVPTAVRDRYSGLLLERAGPQHVDGATALAMVRSRHPEERVDGRWVPAAVDPDGRAATAGAVLSAIVAAGGEAAVRPWRLQQLAWTGSEVLSVDEGTSLADLAVLAASDIGPVEVLPVSGPRGVSTARMPSAATGEAVASAGLGCGG
jgi:LCP family protein required for cell wall assembly